MSTIDKAALIEQAAKILTAETWEGTTKRERAAVREAVGNTLPVIAKALLAPLRELHRPIDAMMYGQNAVTAVKVCAACGTDNGSWQRHPCPTVRLLDAIEAEVSR
jgi:hypothetical protein